MGQAIPAQHPAVVLRSHYTHLRILLAVAMIAVIGLSVAVAMLAADGGPATSASPAAGRSQPAGAVLVAPPRGQPGAQLRVAPLPAGRRYDGGPDEGTRGIVTRAPSARYDGGPDEGSRGPGH
jgi:hypothetical protein